MPCAVGHEPCAVCSVFEMVDVEWNGMGWNGMERDGMGWDGVEWSGWIFPGGGGDVMWRRGERSWIVCERRVGFMGRGAHGVGGCAGWAGARGEWSEWGQHGLPPLVRVGREWMPHAACSMRRCSQSEDVCVEDWANEGMNIR
jgi:hypothetical protein